MKTKIIFTTLLFMFTIGSWITPQRASAQGYVSYQVFYDQLSPYGTWVNTPYGYVWMPDAGSGFVPYSTNGNWVLTADGWTWDSYYPWGWAPFHYGRWYTDPTYGPVWFPGSEWSPGWVTWRRSDDYYGWSAMEPGVSMHDAYGNNYCPHHNYWTAKRDRDFGRDNTPNYYFNNSDNVTIIKNSTVINNTYIDKSHNTIYHGGPDRSDVEKHAGRTVTTVAITERRDPGQNMSKNQMQIYRPRVQSNYASANKPAPSKEISFRDAKPVAQNRTASPAQNSSHLSFLQPFQSKQSNQDKKAIVNNQPKQTIVAKKENMNYQPRQTYTPKKTYVAKQTVQPVPVKKEEVIKQPVITTPIKKDEVAKQPGQTTPIKKDEVIKQPVKTTTPIKKDESGNQNRPTNQTQKQNVHERPPK